MRIIPAALAATIPMWLTVPIAAWITGATVSISPEWRDIVLRVVVVNGVIEEAVHRGMIFRWLRRRRSFLRAASLAATVFAVQHLYLVGTLGVLPGVASVVLALLVAFPLAYAFEAGGNSIVAPGILHVGSNLPIQLLVTENGPIAWLAVPYMGVVLLSMFSVISTGTLFTRVESNGYGRAARTEGT